LLYFIYFTPALGTSLLEYVIYTYLLKRVQVCVCARARERGRESERAKERERESARARERERASEREAQACVCVAYHQRAVVILQLYCHFEHCRFLQKKKSDTGAKKQTKKDKNNFFEPKFHEPKMSWTKTSTWGAPGSEFLVVCQEDPRLGWQ
jgi:hypothetical protein